MVLRLLFRLLMNEKVVDKLANSTPIRRAAKWVVYLFHRTKAIKEDEVIKEHLNSESVRKATKSLEETLRRIKGELENKLKK